MGTDEITTVIRSWGSMGEPDVMYLNPNSYTRFALMLRKYDRKARRRYRMRLKKSRGW